MLPVLLQGDSSVGWQQRPPQRAQQQARSWRGVLLKRETAAWASTARLRKVARTSPWLRQRPNIGHTNDPSAYAEAASRVAGRQTRTWVAQTAMPHADAQIHQALERGGVRPSLDRPATTGIVNTKHQPKQLAPPQPAWPSVIQHNASEIVNKTQDEDIEDIQRRLRPRSVAAAAASTRSTQRAVAALAARPSFGSRAGKTLVLSTELAKYRELIRGVMSLDSPCTKCEGEFVRMKGCKACAGTGKQLPEPELLLWRWPHNHRAWGKVVAKMGKRWAAALPHEDWIGFKKINNHGSTILRVGGANLLHNKRLLFETLLAAGDTVACYIPETYCTHAEFVDAANRPSPDTINEGGGPCKGVGEGCKFSGACDDIWYFKRSFDDNGRGLVVFRGVLSEGEIMDELETRDTEHREVKSRKSSGPRGFKVRRRHKAKGSGTGAKRKTIDAKGTLDGVYQRCAPYMMLWQDEWEHTQHKCDLRVYVAISPDGKAFVYRDAALRTAINEFDSSDLSPKTMVTHPCVIRPTNKAVENGWDDYPGHIFPKIVAGTSAILKAVGVGKNSTAGAKSSDNKMDAGQQDLVSQESNLDVNVVDRSIGEGRALLCGFDWIIRRRNGELWPMLLEINTSPQLMYAKKIGGQEWIDVLERMMTEFVKLIVEPALLGQANCVKEKELGRWVPCETLSP